MEKQEEVIETQQDEPEPETKPEPVETQTKTRVQELIKCPKCDKMVKLKTLKYSHKKTCSGEESNQKRLLKNHYLKNKKMNLNLNLKLNQKHLNEPEQ